MQPPGIPVLLWHGAGGVLSVQRFLCFDPDDPIWPNRDRFVLSIRHISVLLDALLYLCSVKAVNPGYETRGSVGHLA